MKKKGLDYEKELEACKAIADPTRRLKALSRVLEEYVLNATCELDQRSVTINYYCIAETYFVLKQHVECLEKCKLGRVLAKGQGDIEIDFFVLEWLVLEANGNFKQCLKAAEEMVTLAQNRHDTARAVSCVARSQFCLGRFENAVQNSCLALRIIPDNSRVVHFVFGSHAMILFHSGKPKDALVFLQDSICAQETLSEAKGQLLKLMAGNLSTSKQFYLAVLYQSQALKCKKATKKDENDLIVYQNCLADVELAAKESPLQIRVCSIVGCNEAYEKMQRCNGCELYYLCKAHQLKIRNHVLKCPRFPDAIPRVDLSTQCRCCYDKPAQLSRCAKCQGVKYCSDKCQLIDWHRHKLFCVAKE
jgi:tetratricopeptide (TPR) repeat protein